MNLKLGWVISCLKKIKNKQKQKRNQTIKQTIWKKNHLKVFGMASLRKNQKYATETSSKLSKCAVF